MATKVIRVLSRQPNFPHLARTDGTTVAICGVYLNPDLSLEQLGLAPFNPEDLPWWQPDDRTTPDNRLS